MTINLTSSNKVPFKQTYLTLMAEHNSFKEKLLGASSTNKKFPGFCVGFSTKFLHHYNNNSEQKFINNYQAFINKINESLSDSSKGFDPSKIYTAKKGEKTQLQDIHSQQLIKEVMTIQDQHIKTNKLDISNYFNHLINTKNSLKNTIDKNNIKKETYILLDKILTLNLKSKGTHYYFKECEDHIKKIKLDIDSFISCLETNNTSLNAATLPTSCINELKNNIDFKKEKLSKTDIYNLVKIISDHNLSHLANDYKEMNKAFNLNAGNNVFSSIRNREKIDLKDFILKLKNSKEHQQNYIFCSNNHACAIGVREDSQGNKNYAFFNPNTEIIKFTQFSNFANFLEEFVKKYESSYDFSKNNDSSDYSIQFIKFENTQPITVKDITNDEKYKPIFPNRISTENKILTKQKPLTEPTESGHFDTKTDKSQSNHIDKVMDNFTIDPKIKSMFGSRIRSIKIAH